MLLMKDLEKQTAGLRMHTKRRTEAAFETVKDTIKEMAVNGEKITKYAIFKKSGVSRNFVYYNEDVDQLIEQYENKTLKKDEKKTEVQIMLDELREENKSLKEENKEVQKLKKEIEVLRKTNNKIKGEYEELNNRFSQVCAAKGLI